MDRNVWPFRMEMGEFGIQFHFERIEKIFFKQNSFISRKLVGVLTLKHLTKKVVTHNFCLSNPVQNAIEKVILRQFQTAKKDTQLGWAARILEKDEFVAVVDSSDHCIGFITHLDLLSFIAEGASENGHVLNAV